MTFLPFPNNTFVHIVVNGEQSVELADGPMVAIPLAGRLPVKPGYRVTSVTTARLAFPAPSLKS